MAGAGEEEERENPFSFKSFLKRGDGGEKVRTASSKSGSSRKKAASKKTSVSRETDAVVGAKRSSDDENPFSFTKFVGRKSSKPPSHPGQLSSSSGDEESSLTVVNATPSATTLPPHSNHSKTKAKPGKAAASAKSSNSTQRSTPPKNTSSKQTKPQKDAQKELSIFDDSDGSDSDSAGNLPLFSAAPIPSVPAPDIFSAMKKASSSSSSENSPESSRRTLSLGLGDALFLEDKTQLPFDDASELKKLRAENERLQKELTRCEDSLKAEKEKSSSLRGQVKDLKVKEAEDTKALEDMVQKVESNLVTTTKRAVASEATIKKLKQEIANLQVQLSHNTPQAVQQHYEELLRGVKEKSSYASQQLANSAQMADKNIRELVSGVEALKNVAEILQFIDTITELRTHDDRKTT